ncbi:hypothetical protein PGTUg99_015788 [Puccinia graminis f. sp. tritici]|uniref:Uncharacterized protein n=1 Tax=Puccinia graminis f. sp. tritici TaxID=56615 RepID=A0A5B0NI87_PUCGR|nr:hypothetical protein PGTUg99_015788 [Puccinia graminis f. sp. tritici]
MIGISWGNPIQAAWELGIGIAQADPIFSQSCIVARPHYLDIAWPPPLVVEVPGLPSASSLSNLTTPSPSSLHCSPNVGSDSDPIGHRPASPTRRSRPALRFVAGYLIWRPPPLVASPIKRWVGLGLKRTPPGLPHSSFPACPPLRWWILLISPDKPQPQPLSSLLDLWVRCLVPDEYDCSRVRVAHLTLHHSSTYIAWSWYPPPTAFISFSRCARQLVRA